LNSLDSVVFSGKLYFIHAYLRYGIWSAAVHFNCVIKNCWLLCRHL